MTNNTVKRSKSESLRSPLSSSSFSSSININSINNNNNNNTINSLSNHASSAELIQSLRLKYSMDTITGKRFFHTGKSIKYSSSTLPASAASSSSNNNNNKSTTTPNKKKKKAYATNLFGKRIRKVAGLTAQFDGIDIDELKSQKNIQELLSQLEDEAVKSGDINSKQLKQLREKVTKEVKNKYRVFNQRSLTTELIASTGDDHKWNKNIEPVKELRKRIEAEIAVAKETIISDSHFKKEKQEGDKITLDDLLEGDIDDNDQDIDVDDIEDNIDNNNNIQALQEGETKNIEGEETNEENNKEKKESNRRLTIGEEMMAEAGDPNGIKDMEELLKVIENIKSSPPSNNNKEPKTDDDRIRKIIANREADKFINEYKGDLNILKELSKKGKSATEAVKTIANVAEIRTPWVYKDYSPALSRYMSAEERVYERELWQLRRQSDEAMHPILESERKNKLLWRRWDQYDLDDVQTLKLDYVMELVSDPSISDEQLSFVMDDILTKKEKEYLKFMVRYGEVFMRDVNAEINNPDDRYYIDPMTLADIKKRKLSKTINDNKASKRLGHEDKLDKTRKEFGAEREEIDTEQLAEQIAEDNDENDKENNIDENKEQDGEETNKDNNNELAEDDDDDDTGNLSELNEDGDTARDLTPEEEAEYKRILAEEKAYEDSIVAAEENNEEKKLGHGDNADEDVEIIQDQLEGHRPYLVEYFKKIKTMPVTGVVYPGQRLPSDIQKLIKTEYDDDPLSSFTSNDTPVLSEGILPRVPVLLDRQNQDWNSIHTPLLQRILHLWRLMAVKDFLFTEKKRAMQDGSRIYFDLYQFYSLPMPGQDWKMIGTQEIKNITHHVLKYSSLKSKYRLLQVSDITENHIKQVFPHLFIASSPQSPHHKKFWSEENTEWMKIIYREALSVLNDNAHLYRYDQKIKQLIDIHNYLWKFYEDYCDTVADDYQFDIEKKAQQEKKRLELAKAGVNSAVAKEAAEQEKKKSKEKLVVTEEMKEKFIKQEKLRRGETNMTGESVLPIKKF